MKLLIVETEAMRDALAAHIQEYLAHETMLRVELPDDITAASVQNALANSRKVDYSKVDVVLAEQIAKRLVSYDIF